MLERILYDMNRVTGVAGSMIVERNGLIIASALGEGMDDEIVGAMSVAIFSTAEASAERMRHGNMDYIMTISERANTVMTDAGKGVLVVVTEPKANLGLIHIEMMEAVKEIKAVLG